MSCSSSEEELSMVRSITSAFLVALGSAQTDRTEDCRSGTTAERQKIHSMCLTEADSQCLLNGHGTFFLGNK